MSVARPRRRCSLVLLLAALLIVLVGPSSAASSIASSTVVPTRSANTAPRTPVVLIVLENHEYSSVVGSSSAPYLNALIRRGRLFVDYTAVTHPSLPNYLAMTSGGTRGKVGTDDVVAGEIRARNLFQQLSGARVSWNAFEETMPSACFTAYSAGTAPRQYALKHDPAMTYRNIATSATRCARVVPLTALDPSRLPAFSFVTPNLCHDMHSCGVAAGDRWLHDHVPPLLRHGAVVVITFDEGSSNVGGGGRVPTIEVGRGVPSGRKNRRAFDHYSLLAGLERRFGLARLGRARRAHRLPI
jgi:phosphatidylinositol-3-phosphatase